MKVDLAQIWRKIAAAMNNAQNGDPWYLAIKKNALLKENDNISGRRCAFVSISECGKLFGLGAQTHDKAIKR